METKVKLNFRDKDKALWLSSLQRLKRRKKKYKLKEMLNKNLRKRKE